MDAVRAHEKELLRAGMDGLKKIPGIRILGPGDTDKRSGVISFVIEGVHPHDIGSFLDEKGIMIRAGDHCARPLHKKLRLGASARMSFYLYNDEDDSMRVVSVLKEMINVFYR